MSKNMTKEQYQKWNDTADKFMANKKGMGLKVNLSIVKGKLSLSHKMDAKYEQYWKSMQNMIVELCTGAIKILYDEFNASYATKNDFEMEDKRISEIMTANTEEYLRILINQGKEEFLRVVLAQTTLCKTQYMLDRLTFKSGNWQLPNGDLWTGNGWKTQDGDEYFDVVSEICSHLIA